MERRTVGGRWTGTYAYDPMPGVGKFPTIGFLRVAGVRQFLHSCLSL
jgi:hypothetical protein